MPGLERAGAYGDNDFQGGNVPKGGHSFPSVSGNGHAP